MRIAPDSHLADCTVENIHKRYAINILICAVDRDGKVFIPDGKSVLKAGDKIHVSGDHKKIAFFLRQIDVSYTKIKSIMIIGGGRISFYLGKIMEAMGIGVKIIEKKRERCEFLSEALPSALIIEGDGTEESLLSEEGLEGMDAFVALTDMDEENLVVSMYASRMGISKVIAKINRLNYLDILQDSSIDSVVSPKYITASQILQYVRALENATGSGVRTLYRIANDKAEIMEFIAGGNTLHLGEKLVDINLKPNTIIVAIVRKGSLIIPHGQDYILEGDSVIAITTQNNFNDINDIFK